MKNVINLAGRRKQPGLPAAAKALAVPDYTTVILRIRESDFFGGGAEFVGDQDSVLMGEFDGWEITMRRKDDPALEEHPAIWAIRTIHEAIPKFVHPEPTMTKDEFINVVLGAADDQRVVRAMRDNAS